MTEMVRLDRLAKHFGPVHAVEEVSFAVARGEVLGFLGSEWRRQVHHDADGHRLPPAFLRHASVMGFDVVQAPIEVKRPVGYLPEGAPALRRHDRLAFCASSPRCAGFAGGAGTRRIDAAIARTELERGGASSDRDTLQGFQASRRAGPGHHARSAGAGAGRADRRPRSQPEAWRPQADRRDGRATRRSSSPRTSWKRSTRSAPAPWSSPAAGWWPMRGRTS